MSRRIALAGCADWPGGHDDDAGLVEAFAACGVRATWVVWDDPAVDWAEFDLVLIRQTWDYPAKLAPFLEWVDHVAVTASLVNPAPVVRWNHHKRYLFDLRDRGVPVVPTELVPAGQKVAPPWPDAVVKPAVGVGGDGAVRVHEPAGLVAPADVLVQPYVPTIEVAGETSVILLGGHVSHTIRKVPASGEFRVHEHRGGTYEVSRATQAERAVALAALDAARDLTGADIAYARADLVAGHDGSPLVMELELIEPSLYLHHEPGAAATLAAALA